MKIVDDLARKLAEVPSIGLRKGIKIAYFILQDWNDSQFEAFLGAFRKAKNDVKTCNVCGKLDVSDSCSICVDEDRDHTKLCVVKDTQAVDILERSRVYRGLYHVVGGVLDPLKGTKPSDLNIESLFNRLGGVEEITMALPTSVDGNATSLYIMNGIRKVSETVQITELAVGLKIGSDLEKVDELTLAKAFDHRVKADQSLDA